MVASDSLPEVFRASDEDRDEVIRLLRDGSVQGRISQETFLERVDQALHARSADELARLHSDLPPPARRSTLRARVAGLRTAVTGWHTAVTGAVRAVLPAPQVPTLVLPRGPRTVFSIGRSPHCDLPLGDPTVSWHHAELHRTGDTWVLVDVGSKNGTRVNGWRVDSGFTVHPGDCVHFGRAVYRLTDRW
jgi:hypothetical protein